MSRETRTLF